MKKIFTLFFIAYFINTSVADAQVNTVISNGNWGTASRWSLGRVPQAGDSVVVPSNRTITVATQVDYGYDSGVLPIKISVFGDMVFQNGKKLRLPCCSVVYIYPGGIGIHGIGGGNASLIDICNNEVWSSSDGNLPGPDTLRFSSTGCESGLLPVELIHFDAEQKDNAVRLTWSTASELNNSHFDIERSTDGSAFESIAVVAGAGNSNTVRNYEYTDADPLSGDSYYRLKQTDLDGSYVYSKIINVSVDVIRAFRLFPNPSSGIVQVILPFQKETELYEINMHDVSGKLVIMEQLNIQSGQDMILNLKEKSVMPGYYIISLKSNNKVYTSSLVVQ